MGIPISKLKKRWMKEPGFKGGYDALEAEFALASILIEARTRAKLSQQEVAKRMGTSQSTIARLESGAAKPSLSTLEYPNNVRMPWLGDNGQRNCREFLDLRYRMVPLGDAQKHR